MMKAKTVGTKWWGVLTPFLSVMAITANISKKVAKIWSTREPGTDTYGAGYVENIPPVMPVVFTLSLYGVRTPPIICRNPLIIGTEYAEGGHK